VRVLEIDGVVHIGRLAWLEVVRLLLADCDCIDPLEHAQVLYGVCAHILSDKMPTNLLNGSCRQHSKDDTVGREHQ